jgi:hypothetical protein
VSVRELLDSAELALPDTLEFGFREYNTRFTPDYVAQPTIGYSYSNFGRGFYGGAAFAPTSWGTSRSSSPARSTVGRRRRRSSPPT